eukprot:scaffold4097_cov79-Skeletonema_dohrnii-CCMP3373.AAC.1
MADAAAAAAPPGGNDVNDNANHQQPPQPPPSPRRALKITILASKDVASYRICLPLAVHDNAVVMDQALMMARVCRDRERIDIS